MDDNASPGSPMISLRWRITLPFLLLALALGLGGTYLVVRLVRETEDERFLRQLANSGQLASDEVVRAEADLLEVERLVANTEGVRTATLAADAEALRSLVLPVVVNADADVVAIVDEQPLSLLSVRRQLEGGPRDYETVRGEQIYADWPVVEQALTGGAGEEGADKHAGLGTLQTDEGPLPGMFVVGPLHDVRGQVIGAVIVGEYLDDLARRMSEASGGNASIYDLVDGRILATSLEAGDPSRLELSESWLETVAASEDETPVRSLEIAAVPYREALTPLTARGGVNLLGVVGISLIDTVRATEGQQLPVQRAGNIQWVVGFGALGLLLIGLVGLTISHSITRPLVEIAEASREVAKGNLEVQVPERGGGEVQVVAQAFNGMISGLRQATQATEWSGGAALPMAPSEQPAKETMPLPEVRQVEVALIAVGLGWEARGRGETPEQVAAREDRVLAALDTTVTSHRGQLLAHEGERALAVFGLPEERLPRQVSALIALHAAFELLEELKILDVAWRSEGRVGLDAHAAVHGGNVVFSDIGRRYGLAPILLGDTVSLARALLTPARTVESGILISETTYERLSAVRSQFTFGRRGVVTLRAPPEEMVVHEALGRTVSLLRSAKEYEWKEGGEIGGF